MDWFLHCPHLLPVRMWATNKPCNVPAHPSTATTVKKPSENLPIKRANRRRCERKQTPQNRVSVTKGRSWEKTVEDGCLPRRHPCKPSLAQRGCRCPLRQASIPVGIDDPSRHVLTPGQYEVRGHGPGGPSGNHSRGGKMNHRPCGFPGRAIVFYPQLRVLLRAGRINGIEWGCLSNG